MMIGNTFLIRSIILNIKIVKSLKYIWYYQIKVIPLRCSDVATVKKRL